MSKYVWAFIASNIFMIWLGFLFESTETTAKNRIRIKTPTFIRRGLFLKYNGMNKLLPAIVYQIYVEAITLYFAGCFLASSPYVYKKIGSEYLHFCRYGIIFIGICIFFLCINKLLNYKREQKVQFEKYNRKKHKFRTKKNVIISCILAMLGIGLLFFLICIHIKTEVLRIVLMPFEVGCFGIVLYSCIYVLKFFVEFNEENFICIARTLKRKVIPYSSIQYVKMDAEGCNFFIIGEDDITILSIDNIVIDCNTIALEFAKKGIPYRDRKGNIINSSTGIDASQYIMLHKNSMKKVSIIEIKEIINSFNLSQRILEEKGKSLCINMIVCGLYMIVMGMGTKVYSVVVCGSALLFVSVVLSLRRTTYFPKFDEEDSFIRGMTYYGFQNDLFYVYVYKDDVYREKAEDIYVLNQPPINQMCYLVKDLTQDITIVGNLS